MSDRGRPATAALIRALDVSRHAKVGFSIGAVVAIGVYLYRVLELLGPVRDTRGSPFLFFLLAIVLAVALGVLITTVLVVRAAIRLARESA